MACDEGCRNSLRGLLPAAGCGSLDVGCWLLAAGCWLLADGRWLLVAGLFLNRCSTKAARTAPVISGDDLGGLQGSLEGSGRCLRGPWKLLGSRRRGLGRHWRCPWAPWGGPWGVLGVYWGSSEVPWCRVHHRKLLTEAKSDANKRAKAESPRSNTPWAYRLGEFIFRP